MGYRQQLDSAPDDAPFDDFQWQQQANAGRLRHNG
jgi:hypothetical protein